MSALPETIVIDKSYIQEILSIVGYPVLDTDNDDFELSEEQIKTLIIKPALREYFKFFPITQEAYYDVYNTFAIDFADSLTFGAVDVRFNTQGMFFLNPTGNPMVDARFWWGSNYNPYGNATYDYDLRYAYMKERVTNQSMIDSTKAARFIVNQNSRRVEGYSNTPGKLNIIWAKYSNDFNAVPFARINEVLDLCKANLLERLVMMRGQLISGLPNSFNISLFETKAKELKGEVFETWKNFTKVIILKQ